MIAMLSVLLAMTSGSPCTGADPAITGVTTTQTTSAGLTNFTLHITVTNIGMSPQHGNVLQSVSILLDGEKKGQKGLPPLAAGAKYTFPYVVQRAAESAAGTTTVDLGIVMTQPPGIGPADCSAANDSTHVVI